MLNDSKNELVGDVESEKYIRAAELDREDTIFYTSVQVLEYADDIDAILCTKSSIFRMYQLYDWLGFPHNQQRLGVKRKATTKQLSMYKCAISCFHSNSKGKPCHRKCR
ncbi:unnamed protein product, partial [Ceratitis capitata]